MNRFMNLCFAAAVAFILAFAHNAQAQDKTYDQWLKEAQASKDTETTDASGEARYQNLETLVFPSISLGTYNFQKGEEGYWLTPEALINPGNFWHNGLGLPGVLRLDTKVSFTRTHGAFETNGGLSHVHWTQDRILLGFGPNLVLASDKWKHSLEMQFLFQGQWSLPMDRSDGQKGEKSFIVIPELRVTYANTVLPRLFQPSNDAYTSLELLVNDNTKSDVWFIRGTLKYEFLALGRVGRTRTRDIVMGNEVAPGEVDAVSLRLVGVVETFGGRLVKSHHVTGKGGLEVYLRNVPFSIQAVAGTGTDGRVVELGAYFAF